MMLILIFFIALIQIISYWIFQPLTEFLTQVFEIRLLPAFMLLIFIFLFSKKESNQI